MATKKQSSGEPTVTFWGAAQRSPARCTRSMPAARSLLLDCGLFQGHRAESHRRNREVPVSAQGHRRGAAQPRPHRPLRQPAQSRPPGLSRVRSTARRPRAPWPPSCSATPPRSRRRTPPTSTANASKGEPKVEPLYDGRDVYRTLLLLQGGAVRHADGHRPGTGGDVRGRRPPARLGDDPSPHGRPERRAAADVHRRPRPAGAADPARPGPGARRPTCSSAKAPTAATPTSRSRRRPSGWAKWCGARGRRGGKVIIPAFSVGRTQTIVYFLHQLMQRRPAAGPADLRRQPDGGAGDRGVPRPSGMLQRTRRCGCWRSIPICSASSASATSTRSTKASP